jgi:methanethiol S-methyltransferase
MLLDHVILAILWIVYCVLHSILAATSLKKKLQNRFGRKTKYYRLFYTIFSFIFLMWLIYFQVNMPTYQFFELNFAILVSGLIISFSGLVLMIICIGKYFITLSGLRSLVQESVSSELMIQGIHKYVRHPLYLGTFAFIWGLFLLIPYLSLLITNTIITIYTLIGIGLEEKKLEFEFGEKYRQYKSKVPKLIPRIRAKQGRW